MEDAGGGGWGWVGGGGGEQCVCVGGGELGGGGGVDTRQTGRTRNILLQTGLGPKTRQD